MRQFESIGAFDQEEIMNCWETDQPSLAQADLFSLISLPAPVIWVPAPLALDHSPTSPLLSPLSGPLNSAWEVLSHNLYPGDGYTSFRSGLQFYLLREDLSMCMSCFLHSLCIAILLVDIDEHDYSTAIV